MTRLHATQVDASRWEGRRLAFACLGVILGLHLLVSSAFALTYGDRFSELTAPDAKRYETMVKQWLTKGVYGYDSTEPNAYVTPGYPIFLAAIYWVGGDAQGEGRPYAPMVALQILCNAASILLTYAIGSAVFDNRGVGVMAAALIALYPPLFQVPLMFLTESFATTTFLLYVLVQLIALKRSSVRWSVAAGALLAVAVYVRPGIAPVAVAPFVYEFLVRRGDRRKAVVKLAAVSLAAWALVMAPWVVRNQVVLGYSWVFSSHGGDPMLAGVDSYYYEMGEGFSYHGPTYKRWYAEKLEIPKTVYAKRVIGQMLRENPLRTIWWFTVGKSVHMYFEPWVPGKNYIKSITLVTHYLLVVLGLTGMGLAFREPRLRTLSMMIVFGTLALLMFVPEPRFVYGFLPLFAVLAAGVLRCAWQGCRLAGEGVSGA